jgi:hypothetical protein
MPNINPQKFETNYFRQIAELFQSLALTLLLFSEFSIQGLEQSKKEASSSKEGSGNKELCLRSGTGKDAHGGRSVSRDVGSLGSG